MKHGFTIYEKSQINCEDHFKASYSILLGWVSSFFIFALTLADEIGYNGGRGPLKVFLDKGIFVTISQPLYRSDISGHYYRVLKQRNADYMPHGFLLNCHPLCAKMSIAVTSRARQASMTVFLSSSFWRIAHILVKYVALKRIWWTACFWVFLENNIISRQPDGPK